MTASDSNAFYIYVVECRDGSLYTGWTTDVEQRMAAHNLGQGAKYTAARRPVTLLASGSFPTKHQAMSAEFRFKQLSRPQKLALIEAVDDQHPFETILATRLFPPAP